MTPSHLSISTSLMLPQSISCIRKHTLFWHFYHCCHVAALITIRRRVLKLSTNVFSSFHMPLNTKVAISSFMHSLESICITIKLRYSCYESFFKKQGRIHGYRSRVRVGRGHIWGHFKEQWVAARPETSKTQKKLKCDRPTDWQTDGPTDWQSGMYSRVARK